jgi:predicted metal-dependent hydrolase
MPNPAYSIQRGRRRTVALKIEADGALKVLAPRLAPVFWIERIVNRHWDWVARQRQRLADNQKKYPPQTPLDPAQREVCAQETGKRIQNVIDASATLLGVTYRSFRVVEQMSRWGSCSRQGDLRFNWRLSMAPAGVLEYVVVHELAHRRFMNHSKSFWTVVESVLPEYRLRRRDLRNWGRGNIGARAAV